MHQKNISGALCTIEILVLLSWIPASKKFFKCDSCEKTFSSLQYLTVHKETVHLKIKKFECIKCGKTLGQRAHWRTHKKTHDVSEKNHIYATFVRKPLLFQVL